MASESLGFHDEIWLSAGIVGLAGVVSGSLLAHRHLAAREWIEGRRPVGLQAGRRGRRLRRGEQSRLSPRTRREAPAAAQSAINGSIGMWNRAETIVRAWKAATRAAVSAVGPSRRRSFAPARHQPERGQERQRQVARPVDEVPGLGVRLVEEDEVPQPTQAEPDIAAGIGPDVLAGPSEEPARPLGLGDRGQLAVIVRRQGDVVDVARLVPGVPERPIEPAEPARPSPASRARSTDARTTLSVPSLRAQLPCQKA